MISIILNRSVAPQEESVRLKLPATPGEIGKAYKALDLLDGGPIAIFDAECSIPNLRNYIIYAEFNDQESFEQLQELARRIAGMSRKEQALFSGAIENESIHSLADILSISEHLDRYVLLPHIDSDAALGRFLVDSGFKNCPEDREYTELETLTTEIANDVVKRVVIHKDSGIEIELALRDELENLLTCLEAVNAAS